MQYDGIERDHEATLDDKAGAPAAVGTPQF